jgi:hypothetical protein
MFRYDWTTRRYELEFVDDPRIAAPTEVFVPEARLYPQGWRYLVDGRDGAARGEWDARSQILRLELLHRGGVHRIVIEPAPATPGS